ncbi:hypothetical protein ACFL6U_11230 [Planctomycetota bacterium]
MMHKGLILSVVLVLAFTSTSFAVIDLTQTFITPATNVVGVTGPDISAAANTNVIGASTGQNASVANGRIIGIQYQEGNLAQFGAAAGAGQLKSSQAGIGVGSQSMKIPGGVMQLQLADLTNAQTASRLSDGFVGSADLYAGTGVQALITPRGMVMNGGSLMANEVGFLRVAPVGIAMP